MAACVLCRRLPKLRFLGGLRKDFSQTQHVNVKAKDETSKQGAKNGDFPDQESSPQAGYRLHYGPSSYQHSVQNSASSWSQTDNDKDEQPFSTLAPSFWQQGNFTSVSCSQRLSSCRDKPDLVSSKGLEPKISLPLPHCEVSTLIDVEYDTRAYLKCRPEYASMSLDLDSPRPLPIEWEQVWLILQKVTVLKHSMKPSDVCQFLTELGHCHQDKMLLLRNDKRLKKLLQYSVENLHLFTQPQLLEILQSFVWLKIPSTHNVLRLYEEELSSRTNKMSLHQLLLAADLWRCIGRKVPQFLQHLYDKIHWHLAEMGVPELVHLLYIIGEGRHCPNNLLCLIEKCLIDHLQQLHPEEVGTVCLGFFKSKSLISEITVTRIVDKAHSFVKEMSDFAVVNVLKFMRFNRLYHRAWLATMSKEVPQRAQGMGVRGLMHISLACSALHYRNDDILMAIAKIVPSKLPYCRSKDSCKLLWSFGTVGFLPEQSPSFYPSLIESLKQRKAEFQHYPEHLLTGLLGLVFVSHFPEDLIALALSPDFVSLALNVKKRDILRDFFTLDGTVALELPQWTGPRLSCELQERAEELLWTFAQSNLCIKPEFLGAESALRDLLGGEEFVRSRMILPHTRSIDLEVHLDSTGQPIPVNPAAQTAPRSPVTSPSNLSLNHGRIRKDLGVTLTEELLAQVTKKKKTTDPSTPVTTVSSTSYRIEPDYDGRHFDRGLQVTDVVKETFHEQRLRPQDSKGTVKLAIQVPNRNHYCYQSQQLLGLHMMKRRQLNLAGYTVIELMHKEWFPFLKKSRAEKLAYLHHKIYNRMY